MYVQFWPLTITTILIGIIEGDEILMINEKQVLGMKPSTLHQQFKGAYEYKICILIFCLSHMKILLYQSS